MRTVKEIHDVVQDVNLTIEDREKFVNTLTEEEMKNVFLQMCSVYAYKEDDLNE